ncbi:hypothetical protein G6F62_015153 [Rhizopus arrhizus]|nr:hypothetical protein G6F66_015712 [Rhizopus arrhizus]KAG1307834.1 hypothetical protein G6F62_015153 [Rhizopus arrhizus]
MPARIAWVCTAPIACNARSASWQVGSPQLHRNCMKPPLLMSASMRHSATSCWSSSDNASSAHAAAFKRASAAS